MIVHPQLAALRNDDAPQRRAQAELGAALEAWRSSAPIAAIGRQFAEYAAGRGLAELPQLAALFRAGNPAAADLAHGLIDRFVGLLAHEPLGQTPLRFQVDDAVSTLVLLREGGALLILQAVNGPGLARLSPASSARFTPGETYEHLLTGTARANRVRLLEEVPGGARLESTPVVLTAGDTMRRDGARECLHLCQADGTLVSLKLQRRPLGAALTREFDLADGRFIHQAAASARESRLELTATLLARMGRTDAAPLLAAMAEEETGQSLRWQTLKECLGLDTAAGFSALCRIAARADDPLAGPAGVLRAQLLETYPQLKDLAECPV